MKNFAIRMMGFAVDIFCGGNIEKDNFAPSHGEIGKRK